MSGPSKTKLAKSRFSHLPRILSRTSLVLLPVVLLVLFVGTRTLHHRLSSSVPSLATSIRADEQPSVRPVSAPLAKRAIYPFSIVPGGVRDARELQSATTADPLVGRHYSDFRIAEARAIRFDHPLAMYVSYRRNNQVFWTRNRMVIPANEALLSDGENLARVRCANRLSPVALKPVAATEPSKEEMNDPSFVPPLMADLLPGEPVGVFPDAPAAILSGPASNAPPPPIFPPFLGPGVPPIIPSNSPVPPPTPAPEPNSLALLLCGVVLVALLFALSLRRNSSF